MYTAQGKLEEADLLEELMPTLRRQALALQVRLPPNVSTDDLVQAGSVGLLEAIRNYQPSAGASLKTYATNRAQYAMLDELRSRDPLSRTTRAKLRKAQTHLQTLQRRLGRAPTEPEMAAELGMKLDAYRKLLESANAGLVTSDAEVLCGIPADEAAEPLAKLLHIETRAGLVEAIRALPERERRLLALYYQEDLHLKEIGAVLGVSESRVCQLHSQALMRLRVALSA